ncbi:proline racemase family protein [Acidaminobacter sp. JC074]|uniref:proline racemase family protein n=1 Tax=Acidaminobacter sp. JC074 TaxID=2530199 RepID=UPI001F0FB023|nr:proline racemase family protein [Acidaminobacter sp. JC074]
MFNTKWMIDCIDAHTGGEPLRIITSGLPPIPGDTILKKRSYVKENLDHLRKLMMLEPRGHDDMYGCIMVDPVTDDGDFGVLFTHNEGLSTMCGHGIIAVTKTMIELGRIPSVEGENVVRIDSPAGRITAFADVEKGEVKQVRFRNVPCFMYKEDISIHLEGYGDIVCDIVYCGAFYIYVNVNKVNLSVLPEYGKILTEIGMKMKYDVEARMEIMHPVDTGITGIYGTIFYEDVVRDGQILDTKNVCIFAEGQVDRSPTGTGTGGRVALHYHKGEMKKGDTLKNLSIIDTLMCGKVLEETEVAGYKGVITEVSGTAHIMGINKLLLDPQDPLPEGFRIR